MHVQHVRKGAGMGPEFKAVNGIIEIRSSSSTRTSSLFGFESCVRAFAFAALYTLYFVCIYVEQLTTYTAALLSLLLPCARSQRQQPLYVHACARFLIFLYLVESRDAIRPSTVEIPKENVIM
jgi:hypothetical protein